jgi:hypothetical protein
VTVALWLVAVGRLMIADVWDETNGMVAFGGESLSLAAKLDVALTESLGFWRPLPTALVVSVLHLLPGSDVAWLVLRAANAVMLLVAVRLLLNLVRPSGPLRLALTLTQAGLRARQVEAIRLEGPARASRRRRWWRPRRPGFRAAVSP